MKTTSATAEECIIVQILSGFSLDWWLCFNGEFVVPVKLFHFVSYIRAPQFLKVISIALRNDKPTFGLPLSLQLHLY